MAFLVVFEPMQQQNTTQVDRTENVYVEQLLVERNRLDLFESRPLRPSGIVDQNVDLFTSGPEWVRLAERCES